jgi:hypothetical protein
MLRLNFVRATLPLFLLTLGATVHAQDSAAQVEALFADGKKLMAEGRPAEACPKFLASYNLDHRVGTVLNLADCYEKSGQIASAWARFIEARTLAMRSNQNDRVKFAADHAAALEPRRSLLTIMVDHPPPGLVVHRDGLVVDAAAYGIAVPVDGGSHLIEATAPDKAPFSATVVVGAESDKKTFTVAGLVDAARAPVAAVRVEAPKPVDAPPPQRASSTRVVIGLGLAGAGVIATGIGAVFGVEAGSKNSDSYANGDCVGAVCNQTGFNARSTARSDGTISTVLIGVGAAAVVGGVVLWLTAPRGQSGSDRPSPVAIGIGPTGLIVKGEF